MKRFRVINHEEAKVKYQNDINDPHFLISEDRDWGAGSYLFDTKDNIILWKDGGEPEDQCLHRDLLPLVNLLNRVAEGN